MADDADTPPFHWLFGRSGRQRQAVQYWVGDTAKGLLSIAVHTGLKALPIDACSAFGAMLAKKAWPAPVRILIWWRHGGAKHPGMISIPGSARTFRSL